MRLFGFEITSEYPQVTPYNRELIDSESILETWLHANPEVMLDECLLIIGRQSRLDTGIPDLLALDQWANVVVIELKKGSSGSGSASEETILGQPQTYAQSLSRYDYEDLNDLYRELRRKMLDKDGYDGELPIENDSLKDAFEAVFGSRLETDQYNEHQRIVIVAEKITTQTEASARYLLDQGLNVQCVEVQLFNSLGKSSRGDGYPLLASNMVVDYDTKRVKPKNQGAPKYPEVAEDLIKRAFIELEEVVEAPHYSAVIDGLEGYEPGIKSNAPYHPDPIKYAIHLRPLEWGPPGKVRIDLKIPRGGEDAYETIMEHADRFRDCGFEVTGNTSLFVVIQDWEVENTDPLYDDDFREEVSHRFAELVMTSHEVFRESSGATDD